VHRKKRRILAMLLVLILVCTTCSSFVSADMNQQKTADGLCEHHPEHTAECGYVEATEGSPCTHEHTDECYTTDENGEQILDCQHVHDESCGYVEATEGSPCTYECAICDSAEEDVGDNAETETVGENAETADSAILISSWSWVDEEGLLQEMDGVWGLGMPGASEENPLTSEALLEMLPKQITAETSEQPEAVTLDLTWDLSEIPEEGIWSGDHVFAAGLPEGYALAEDVDELSVTVQLGGAATYASQANLNANMIEGVSPQGTTINVFDYWLSGQDDNDQSNPVNYQNRGINSGEVLKFGNGMGTTQDTNNLNRTNVNHWTGNKNVRPGIVSSTLTDGYPALSSRLGNDSLAYLFDPTVTHDGKASYSDVTGLLQVDGDGYFYYNSQDNFAELNTSTNAFVLYDEWGVSSGGHSPNGQFFPFNTGAEVFRDQPGNGITQNNWTSTNAGINHYFGLTMTTRFVQQYGGHTEENGDVVTYEFSGDDDVWVFIDDVLVADLGGIHDAASLTIDFSTGAIRVNGSSTGTLREMYQAAGRTGSTSWNKNTFADNTYHTLSFFYLERGNVDSNMQLKFNLVTIPESGIIKVDQAGNHIAGAQFALYQTDDDYVVDDDSVLICSGTTDADGELIFVDDEGMIVSLADLYSREVRYMVLRETDTPSGYRTAGDMNLRFYTSRNGDVVLLSSNEWETGSYASSKVTTQTGPSISAENGEGTANLDQAGTLFAVVLQKQSDGSWKAVYGDPEKGWHVTDQSDVLTGVIEAAQQNPYEFEITASGAYEANVENLPGDITQYYYMLAGGNQNNAEYTVGYYYTSASSVSGATTGNTWLVDSNSFQRVFSVSLYVANIQNNLYVQKLDENGDPVSAESDGSAQFALYKASDVTVSNDGTYSIRANANPVMSQTTGDMESPLPLDGGAMFSRIPEGEYYLIETSAPPGYQVEASAIAVVVDNSGVYADAGAEDDAVTVRRGVGSVVRSMLQFATDDDIDATLHGIQATLYTTSNYSGDTTSWSGPVGDTLHLQFENSNRVLEYGPISDDKNAYFEVDAGWSKLAIHQCLDDHQVTASSPKQDLVNGAGNSDLVNLFSGTVTVRIQNQRVGDLKISKTVTGVGAPEGTKFTFTLNLTEPLEEGESETEASPLAGTYTGTVYNSSGEPTGDTVTVKNGTGSITLQNGQYILFENLPADTNYTVTETSVPNGYTASVTVDGTLSENGSAGEGTVPHNDTAEVAFTNTYSRNVTLTGETALKGQKTLDGRNLTENDSYGFTLTPSEGTQEAIRNEAVVPAEGYNTASVSGDGTSDTAGFTFGNITFTEEGEYTFTITENLPQGVSSENPTVGGVTYDTHSAEVTVVVTANAETGLLEAEVTYSNSGAPSDADAAITDRAAFTNRIVSSFSFTKTDRDGMEGEKLSGATFAMYRLICSNEEHKHNSSLIEISDAETGAIASDYEYADCWELAGTVTSGSDGIVEFAGLPISGEYRLVEIKAPDGFALPDGQYRIVYDTDTGVFGPAENDSAVGKPVAIGTDDGKYYIQNYKPGELPFAGNTGIKMFLLIGGILMAAGAVGFCWYLRRKRRLA
jgi:pilin isopeptide linkage protein/fibro-slime domain-containing protein